MQLHEFLDHFRDSITRSVIGSYPPLYDLAERRSGRFDLRRLGRRPLGGQADAIRAAALSIQRQPSTVVVGEMGSGKSFIAAAAAYLAGCRRVLVICPPHLVKKWEREVRMAVPGTRVAIARRIEDLERIRRYGAAFGASAWGSGGTAPPVFVILSREGAKLGYRWRPAVIERLAIPRDGTLIARDERGRPLRVLSCPRCGTPIVDDEGVPLTRADLGRKRLRCTGRDAGRHPRRPEVLDRRRPGPHDRCNAPLWTADRTGPRRYPLADYIRKRMRGHFDLVIGDECFPAWTPVRTPGGSTPIRDLKPGDTVLSYRGGRLVTRTVVRVWQKRRWSPLVRVTHERGNFLCTPDHRVYTIGGRYVAAGALTPAMTLLSTDAESPDAPSTVGDHDADHREELPDLRGSILLLAASQARGADVQPDLRRAAPPPEQAQGPQHVGAATATGGDLPALQPVIYPQGAQSQSDVLWQELLDESPLGGYGDARQADARVAELDRGTACARPRTCPVDEWGRDDSGEIGGHNPRSDILRGARGQRATDASTTPTARGTRLADGALDPHRESVVAGRGGGPGRAGVEDRDRVRRPVALLPEAAQSGRAEDGDADDAGLDRPALLERANHREHRGGTRHDPALRASRVLSVEPVESDEEWVYDLEIDETHCYFAGDVLVHNCQDYKGRGSAQGIALAALVGATGRSLLCTGTLLGGYASTIFTLLYRVNPAIRREFGFGEETRWVQRYGIVERITTKDGQGSEEYDEDGRTSKRRAYRTRTIERPGISPAILFNLIGNTVFLRLADVAAGLPGYEERVVLFDLDDEDAPLPVGASGAAAGAALGGGATTTSQSRAYRALAQTLREAVLDALQSGSKRLLGAYLQSLLAYPDGCTREEIVLDRGTGIAEPRVIAAAPALPADRRYPKERALVELALRERGRGRRLLIYVGHTETRDLTPRLKAILEAAGLRVAILKSHTVAADRREEWVAARVREGLDALIVNPRIVQTGLDLLEFAAICWYQLDYSTYVMRQASRRSWRIGQKSDVVVFFFTYRGTLQAEALHLVKQKVRASLLIEGELPEEGLAATDGEDEDSLLALARRLVAPGDGATDTADDRSLEALFAQARQLEAEADEELVDLADDPAFAEALEAHFAEVEAPGPASVSVSPRPVAPPDLAAARGGPDAPEATGTLAGSAAFVDARVVRFEELALALAPRRKGRGKAITAGQLSLFGP